MSIDNAAVTRHKQSVGFVFDRMNVGGVVIRTTKSSLLNGMIGIGNRDIPFVSFGNLLIASLKRRVAQGFLNGLLIDIKVVLYEGKLKISTLPSST